MGTQLPLPAGWARNYHGFRDARDRLDELVQDRLDAKAEIRAVLDRLTEKYDVPTADVTAAMGWVDDGLGDLLYLTDRAVDGSLAGSASLYPVGAQAQSCEVEMTYVLGAVFFAVRADARDPRFEPEPYAGIRANRAESVFLLGVEGLPKFGVIVEGELEVALLVHEFHNVARGEARLVDFLEEDVSELFRFLAAFFDELDGEVGVRGFPDLGYERDAVSEARVRLAPLSPAVPQDHGG